MLSPLTSATPFKLYEDDGIWDPKEEYWDYLSSIKGVEEKEDGLLVFLFDLFKNI